LHSGLVEFYLAARPDTLVVIRMTIIFRSVALLFVLALNCVSSPHVAAQPAQQLRINANRVPIDLSFLNEKPAGLRGHLKAVGADLEFEDGTPARFWGANVQAYAIFSTAPIQICSHARRIASLGFNLVRLHHHDSHWVRPNIFGVGGGNTLSTDPVSLDRIGRWVACLKAEGVYTWLDLHVGRRITNSDGISLAEEIVQNSDGDVRGFNFVNDTVRERMAEFQAEYLSYFNPHTGLAFKDDPAVAFVMISNENDATYHFANRLLPDKNVPGHTARYLALANAFAGTTGLKRSLVWRSWEHGASKKFLNDLEYRFYGPLSEEIRKLGFKGITVTSSMWGGMGAAGLPSLTIGDAIDVHSYGRRGIGRTDPTVEADMISYIAGAQVAGKPLTISEWNISPWPEDDRFLAPLRMGAAAAHQGWDAPIIYGYAQHSLGSRAIAYNWHIAEDPSLLGPLAVAALLYRRGDVAVASRAIAIAPSDKELFGASQKASTSNAIRMLAERSRLFTQLPKVEELRWFEPPQEHAHEVFAGYDLKTPSSSPALIVSDTGEIRRNSDSGTIWIETEHSLVIAGDFRGDPQKVGGLNVFLNSDLAGVALQSLDGVPIADSSDLLVTIMGPSWPVEDQMPPFLVEKLRGIIEFEARPTLLLDASMPYGGVAHSNDDAMHSLTFEGGPSVGWIRLTAP